jgi:hypothetical protein
MTLKCRGGILADGMGMGKSLTLLSLILHTLEEARSFGENPHNSMMERETKGATRATLLIAPKSSAFFWSQISTVAMLMPFSLALSNWQMQVKEYIPPSIIYQDMG